MATTDRITINPDILGGKPTIRGHRLAVEHVLSMLEAGDDFETILEGYDWLERDDLLACLAYQKEGNPLLCNDPDES